ARAICSRFDGARPLVHRRGVQLNAPARPARPAETALGVRPSSPPVVASGQSARSVTETISEIVLRGPSLGWLALFAFSGGLTLLLLIAIIYLLVRGIGIWGNNIPVAWAFDITNFVWWIGIGHAGTLISAVLLLFRQQWRTS